MGWVGWLAVPVVVTALVAVASWYRSRPVRRPRAQRAVQAHDEYLDALVQPPRSSERGPVRLAQWPDSSCRRSNGSPADGPSQP